PNWRLYVECGSTAAFKRKEKWGASVGLSLIRRSISSDKNFDRFKTTFEEVMDALWLRVRKQAVRGARTASIARYQHRVLYDQIAVSGTYRGRSLRTPFVAQLPELTKMRARS